MRWLFLLLVVLNIVFFTWHQQEAPVQGKVILPLSVSSGVQQGIRLLSEAQSASSPVKGVECFSLLGVSSEEQVQSILRRLTEMAVEAVPAANAESGYALSVRLHSRSAVSGALFKVLSTEFNGLQYKKIPCWGLQLPDSLHRMAPAPQ